jgi:hypothetical protein
VGPPQMAAIPSVLGSVMMDSSSSVKGKMAAERRCSMLHSAAWSLARKHSGRGPRRAVEGGPARRNCLAAGARGRGPFDPED